MYYSNQIAHIAPVSSKTGLLSRFVHARALAKQRRALANLSDTRLADLGISRAQAVAESNRSPWNAPSHWRK